MICLCFRLLRFILGHFLQMAITRRYGESCWVYGSSAMSSSSNHLVFSLQLLDLLQIFLFMCAAAIPCWTDSGQKEHCILLLSFSGRHTVYTANSVHLLLICCFFHAAFSLTPFLKLFFLLMTSVQFSNISDYIHLFSLWSLAAFLLQWAAFPVLLSLCL